MNFIVAFLSVVAVSCLIALGVMVTIANLYSDRHDKYSPERLRDGS